MKPRRLLFSVDVLPTISEIQENVALFRAPSHHSQCLEEYTHSIRELAQPTSLHHCRPLRAQRSQRSDLSTTALSKRSSVPQPHGTVGAHKPCTPRMRPGDVGHRLAPERDNRKPGHATRDPLDWLFAQTQHRDS